MKKPFNGRPATTKRRGTITYGNLANGATASGTVTFPTPFGGTPDVTITPVSSRVNAAIITVTATSFEWVVSNWSGGSVGTFDTAHWVATAP